MALLKIFKGDDTGGTFGRSLTFTLTIAPGTPTEGCRAEFEFDGIVKVFAAPIVSGETREIVYTHAETASMELGTRTAIFRLIDAQGRIRTLDNTVRVCVTDIVSEVYPGSSTATVVIGTGITWEQISGKPLLVKTINGVPPDASGNAIVAAGGTVKSATINGGSKIDPDASGNLPLVVPTPTVDYTALTNKPQIGGVTLSGNKTAANLGLVATNDPRMTNARTPTAHATSHAAGQSDAILPSDIGAANATHTHTKSQITDFAHTHAQSDVTGLGDALAAKRDRTDMFTEWVCTPALPSGYSIGWTNNPSSYGEGWYIVTSGSTMSTVASTDRNATNLHWNAEDWERGYEITATRQRILTTGDIDATPTASSANPVQSGGVATALADKLTKNAPGGGYSIGWDSSNRLSLNGYLMATGISGDQVYSGGNPVLTSHQDISGKANKSDFALPSGGGAPSAEYVSSLFTSSNTSYNGNVIKIESGSDTTIKSYIDTTVGTIETALAEV